MDYKVNRCKICYSELKIQSGKDKYVKCPYCGCINVAEVTDSLYQEKLDGIYRYLRDAEFEKANEALRDLLKKYPKNGELYFIKVLIDSRIVYVDDGEKKIPTYTNINFEIDNKDNAKKAIDYTDNPEEKKFYKAQLELIEKDKEEIQKIISSKENKYNYDVFISFKKSVIGNPSKDTEDFKLADKIYKHLLKEHHNLKVFYAPESLKAGESWERQIFNALYRSKCMIVIGSDIDNLNSPWVKNEWNRYLEMLNAGKKAPNSLIPVVIGGDFYSVLPSKLSAIQGLAADVSLLNELSKMLKEIFKSGEGKKLEAKKYEAFTGVKVSKEKADDVDIDLEAILVLAETDKKLADREIQNFDQNNPKVKEVKFIVDNGNIYDASTYDRQANNSKFFDGLTNIINGDNIDQITDTIISYISNKTYAPIKKVNTALFILPYIENLSDSKKSKVIKAIHSHLLEVVNVSFGGDNQASTEAIRQLAKELDIYLTIEEISDEDKQNMLYKYCSFLNGLLSAKAEKNQLFDDLDVAIKNRLQYLKYENLKLKKSEYKPFEAKLSDTNWLAMCAENVNVRSDVYANLIVNYNKVRKYNDVYVTIDDLIKDSDNDKLIVILYYLKMIAVISDAIWNKKDNYETAIDRIYQDASLFIAKKLKDSTLLGELKEKVGELKTLAYSYMHLDDGFVAFSDSYSKMTTSKTVKSIENYNSSLYNEVTNYLKDFDEHRSELVKVFKDGNIAERPIAFKRCFDYIPEDKKSLIAYKILGDLNDLKYFDKADSFIEFLSNNGFKQSDLELYKKNSSKGKKKEKSKIAKEKAKKRNDKIKKKIGAGASAVASGAGTGFKAIGIFMLGYGGMFIYIVATILQFLFFHDVNFVLYTSIAQIVGFIYTYIRHLIIREEDDFEFNFSNILLNIFAHYGWFLVFYIASTMDPGGENKILLIPTIVNSLLFVANYVVQFINLGDEESAGVCKYLNPFISVGALTASLVPFFMYGFGKQPEFIFYVEGIYNAAEPNINIYFNLFIAVLLISQVVLNSISVFIMYSDDSGSSWIIAVANLLVIAAAIVFLVAVFTIAPEGEGEAVDAFWNFYVGSVTPAFITAVGGGVATLTGFILSFDL